MAGWLEKRCCDTTIPCLRFFSYIKETDKDCGKGKQFVDETADNLPEKRFFIGICHWGYLYPELIMYISPVSSTLFPAPPALLLVAFPVNCAPIVD